MKATDSKFKTVDEYIAAFPKPTQDILQELRNKISDSAPEAQELISYNMPAFKLGGILVYYAAYKNHIGFYPTPSAIEAFKKELATYEQAKGSVQFPIDKPLPLSLISKIVKYRVRENLEKTDIKRKGK